MTFARKLFFSFSAAFIIFFLAVLPSAVFASTTDGTIDSTYKYAKGLDPNVGKINFGLTAGNVHTTDTPHTGCAWRRTADAIAEFQELEVMNLSNVDVQAILKSLRTTGSAFATDSAPKKNRDAMPL